MRHAATLLLLLAAAITCRAQIEGMPDLSNLGIPDGIGDVISDIFGHRECYSPLLQATEVPCRGREGPLHRPERRGSAIDGHI